MDPLSSAPGIPDAVPPLVARPPRQRLATASLTLGLLGNLGLGPIAGVPAVITGHMAFARSRRSPHTHGGRGVAIAGFVLGYVSFLLGLPVLAVLLSLAVPPVLRQREAVVEARCREQLTALAGAVRQHAETHGARLPGTLAELGKDAPGAPEFTCPGSRPRPYRATQLEWTAPSPDSGSRSNQPILRCPAHGHTVTLAGVLHEGRPGIRRTKSGD